ncbi:hypothetical protein MKJ04_22100 [Pontibacter sp. E15-1]|uniref:hypothetical protein n=1 Tax=Pontibacter sp. E15-1 TaxID=2919918 RepID=UPI001F4FF837|nr:hypothetical protein [Pontibacter sp. E15-1]MCJ8167551.1 hypothetical protein [Pontibacter sp. E15-1]
MEPITIPYHLLLPTIISCLSFFVIFRNRKKLFISSKKKPLWVTVTVLLILYSFIVGGATYDHIYVQWNLNRYDLDGDGFFAGDEITKEQEAAMIRLTSDVGRNYSAFIGLIIMAVLAQPIYILVRLIVNTKTASYIKT